MRSHAGMLMVSCVHVILSDIWASLELRITIVTAGLLLVNVGRARAENEFYGFCFDGEMPNVGFKS